MSFYLQNSTKTTGKTFCTKIVLEMNFVFDTLYIPNLTTVRFVHETERSDSCMGRIYGYCRINTQRQNIERQIRNIKAVYSDALIYQEAYTGTKMDRPKF